MNEDLTVEDIKKLIHEYINPILEDAIKEILTAFSGRKNRSKDKIIDRIKDAPFRSSRIFLHHIPFFKNNTKFHQSINGRISSKKFNEWVDSFDSQEDLIDKLSKIIAESTLEGHEALSWGRGSSGSLINLLDPSLLQTIDNYIDQDLSVKELLSYLYEFYKSEELQAGEIRYKELIENHSCIKRLEYFKSKKIEYPRVSNFGSVRYYRNFRTSIPVLLILLRIKKQIILPIGIGVRSPWPEMFVDFKAFDTGVRRSTTSISYLGTHSRKLLFDIIAASNISDMDDIPEDIGAIIKDHSFKCKLTNTTFTSFRDALEAHPKHKNHPFPIHLLHQVQRQKLSKALKYSEQWLIDNDVPEPWQRFFRLFKRTSKASEGALNYVTKNILEWSWFQRGFVTPNNIKLTDLIDPNNPTRKDTLFAYLKGTSIKDKGNYWNECARVFRYVVNCDKLSERPYFISNPFEVLENPFPRSNSNTSVRRRIPNNLHAALVEVLREPDEKGNPYTFVRDKLGYDWYDSISPNTKKPQRLWCPSRARLLHLLLCLPLRQRQAMWLDQGLMDEYIWDIENERYTENKHPLRNWKHHETHKTHHDLFGRPSGILQPIRDFISQTDELCLFINTNKTQMWNPDSQPGYEMWWPEPGALKKTDIALELHQKHIIEEPWNIIKDQIRWMNIYNPNPIPVTFTDVSKRSVNTRNSNEYPYFVPIFRDISATNYLLSTDGTRYYRPVTRQKLEFLFSALCYETHQRLKEQGITSTLIKKSEADNTSRSYKGYVPNYDLHSLRVFGISYLIELGIPIEIVQMIVGHKTPVMTLYYNKPTPEFMKKQIINGIKSTDILGEWDKIADDIQTNKPEFLITNNHDKDQSFTRNHLIEIDYKGMNKVPGGLCPVSCNMCHIGQVIIPTYDSHSSKEIIYGKVEGGCANCRFFCTSPAHLFDQQMVANDLFIEIRSYGKKQKSIARCISEIEWNDEPTSEQQVELENLKNELIDVERQTEPKVREWMNRFNLYNKCLELLDDYNNFVKSNSHSSNNSLTLVSASSASDLLPEITMRLERSGEFDLALQTLRSANLLGDIGQCSELSRLQMNQFMERIIRLEDSRFMLLDITDQSTRDKVAYLLSESLSSLVGSDTIQKALNQNISLSLATQTQIDMKKFIDGIINNAIANSGSSNLIKLIPQSWLDELNDRDIK